MKRPKLSLLWMAAAGALTLLGGMTGVQMYAALETLPAGVRIEGVSASVRTWEEAENELRKAAEALAGKRIRLIPDDSAYPPAERTAGELGYRLDWPEFDTAREKLEKGPALARAWSRWKLRGTSFYLTLSRDGNATQQQMLLAWPPLANSQPKNAVRIVHPDDRLELVDGQAVKRVDWETFGESMDRLFPAQLLTASDSAAPLDTTVPLKTVEPRVTLATLRLQRVEAKLAEYTTAFSGSGEGRAHNIRAAAAAADGVLLAPGELFDYGRLVKQAETQYGFREAPVILNGKLVPGIGGGICQVSTTLYNTLLLAGFRPLERRNHSLPVSYVPLGQDATFAEGAINFRFRNETDAYLLVKTFVTNEQLTVKLYGRTPERPFVYELRSQIIQTLEPPVRYVTDSALPKGGTALVSVGKPGFVVETYRDTRYGGALLSSSLISKDTYPPQPRIVATSEETPRTPSSPYPAPSLIEDGLQTIAAPAPR
ncbi:hypothetical protein J31TS4_42880 [Paenibacillus sp. J31TS4]|uniref:VanW family protein n=1 Tax=Paenibacillus sp. J31TS4 TaxID=2807195 RepID=UPI001B07E987|nr:VanW family protein [Paenibacillus sp. J31TS4]GIP41008.1 hypothetical protein J31TS4_42880 [Paenibacillus sp. J31TS4]